MSRTVRFSASALLVGVALLGGGVLALAASVEKQTVTYGLCCVDGQLRKATDAECEKFRGRYYRPGQEAVARKECQPEQGLCCVDGQLNKATEEECKKQRGRYYRPGQEAVAKKECQPEQGLCCVDGQLNKATAEECKKQRGRYYRPGQEAVARKECQPEQGLCCVDGQLNKATAEECKKQRGRYYRPGQEAVARKECQPEQGLCCVDGQLNKATAEECKKQRGRYYRPGQEAAARKECQSEQGLCCFDGQLQNATEADCRKQRGTYYRPGQEAMARRECRPEEGACCVDGQLQKATEEECRKQRGQYYRPGLEAMAQKQCQSESAPRLVVPQKEQGISGKMTKGNGGTGGIVQPQPGSMGMARPDIARPDLEAVRVWSETAGGLNRIAAEFRNNGPAHISEALLGRIKASLTMSEMSPIINDVPLVLFRAGSSAVMRFELPRERHVNDSMSVFIDSTTVLTETNENNNRLSGNIGDENDRPDLVITDLIWDQQADGMLAHSSERHFHFRIQNWGTVLSDSQWRNLRIRVSGGGRERTYLVRDVATVGNVTALNSSYVNVSMPAADLALSRTQSVTGFIDAQLSIVEANEDNNSFTKSINFGPLQPAGQASVNAGEVLSDRLPDNQRRPPDPSDLQPAPMAKAPGIPAAMMAAASAQPQGGEGVLKMLPHPTIRILGPSASTFFTVPGRLAVIAQWMDATMAGAPPVAYVKLLDQEDREVVSKGNGALTAPASGTQNVIYLDVPAGTSPGLYKIKWDGNPHWGESEVFNISSLGSEHNGVTITYPTTGSVLTNRGVDVIWQAWGDGCNPDGTFTFWLFKGSSSGVDHRHWLIRSSDDDAERTNARIRLPDDAENGDDYFLRIDVGPGCDGTSGFFTINR